MDEFPQCTVCSTRFKWKGPEPKLLPCLHAVCAECSSSNKTLNCSVCRKLFHRKGLALPKDTVRLATIYRLTAKYNPSEFLCTHRDDGNQAMSWCQECEEFFCEYCQNIHDEFKLIRKHKMKAIGELAVLGGTEDISGSTYCREHDMPLEVYDEDCECLVCYKCLHNDHVNHRTVPAEECLKHCSKELESFLEDITQKQTKTSDLLSLTYHVDTELEERAKTLTENIRHTFQELRTIIDQREKEVLIELDESLQHHRNTNISRQVILKSIERNYSTAHHYLSMASQTSVSHVLDLMGCIKDGIRDYTNVEIAEVREREDFLTFSKDGLDDLKKAGSLFGCICAAVDVSRQTADDDADNNGFEKERERHLLDDKEVVDNRGGGVAAAASQVQETQRKNWRPFPERWYTKGTLTSNRLAKDCQMRMQTGETTSKRETSGIATIRDDREGFVNHPSKGKITTYLFTEKQYSHCYFDRESGSWLKLPIEWELHHERIRNMVDQVQDAVPHIKDRFHILAALRACHYSPEECISMYFHLEGDEWMDMTKPQNTFQATK